MSIMQRRPRKCQGILVIVFILNGNKPNARNNLESQFNPFWPSLDIFRMNFQCLWIRYSLTLIGKLLGRFWDRLTGKVFQENSSNRQLENTGRFTGKLIQKKAFRWKSYFMNSGVSHIPFYLKTHPIDFLTAIIYDM